MFTKQLFKYTQKIVKSKWEQDYLFIYFHIWVVLSISDGNLGFGHLWLLVDQPHDFDTS